MKIATPYLGLVYGNRLHRESKGWFVRFFDLQNNHERFRRCAQAAKTASVVRIAQLPDSVGRFFSAASQESGTQHLLHKTSI